MGRLQMEDQTAVPSGVGRYGLRSSIGHAYSRTLLQTIECRGDR